MERTFAMLDHDVRTEEDQLLPRMQHVDDGTGGCAYSAGRGS
jgi:hypothetical protein